MKSISFTLTLILLSLADVQSQNPDEIDWHEGIIILEDNTIEKGDIAYDYITELVMCRQDGQVKVFGPGKARAFRYFNEDTNIIHKFEAYTVNNTGQYGQKVFFEIILKGHINFIRKRNKHRFQPNFKSYLMKGQKQANSNFKAYDYFAETGGEMIRSKRFYKDLLPGLMELDETISEYMNKNKLKSYDIRDQIVLLNYYNQNETNLPPYALFSTGNLKSDLRRP